MLEIDYDFLKMGDDTFQSFGLLAVVMTLTRTSFSAGSLPFVSLGRGMFGIAVSKTHGIGTSFISVRRGLPETMTSFMVFDIACFGRWVWSEGLEIWMMGVLWLRGYGVLLYRYIYTCIYIYYVCIYLY